MFRKFPSCTSRILLSKKFLTRFLITLLSIGFLSTGIASTSASPISSLTNEEKKEIEEFLQHSNTVHDIVQEEVSDSLGRFLGILALLGTLAGFALKFWVDYFMKEQMTKEFIKSKEDIKSEFRAESVKLMENTSGLLGLVVSIEDIKVLSDSRFSPISTESLQTIENYPDILEKFKESFKLTALPASFNVKLGDVLFLIGRYKLINSDSNHDENEREKAIQYFKKAIDIYKEAFEIFSRQEKLLRGVDRNFLAEVLCKKGNAWSAIGQYKQAIREYEDALEISKDYYWAIHSQGDALARLVNKSKEAHEKYDEALKIKAPENWIAETHYKKGLLYASENKDIEAINSYEESLKFNPDNTSSGQAWVFHSLGDSLTKLGKDEEAIQKYEEAIRINPRQYQSLYRLGDVLCKLGGSDNFNKAIEKYERASEIASEDGVDDYEIQQKLGNAYLRLGNYSNAIIHYDKAIKLGSTSFRMWACRAYANEKLLRVETFSETEKQEHDKTILEDRKIAIQKVNDENHKLWGNRHNQLIEQATTFYERSVLHALAHEREYALTELSKAIQLNEQCQEWAKMEIGFLPLQTDCEFKKLIENKEIK
ncbi:tetratricopeptide repeat protein [Calothrix sp. UHCC 0171]|uniref:tetratricopeptide repeat protein n=1 Tax=Calothrix sp. UHCC 0171 TaxID=3110245 RepID=UPI002B1F079C|nr:tetratricopeptide repeat protein [Calothrix sp. UHCC 0171]MEA5569510.1 tetratricopeptide repeat protein [Calothrix sp. UHCC 0171]